MGARTRGCIYCKARHVKCDVGVPSCRGCLKAGTPCKYASRFSFIDDTVRTERKMKSRTAQQDNYVATANSGRSMYHASLLHTSSHGLNHRSMSMKPLKDTIYLSFLAKKFSDQEIGGGPLIRLHDSSRASYAAFRAVAALVFGQAYRSTDIIIESHRAYGRCLSLLQEDISDPTRSMSFETSETVAALCMYEVSQEPFAMKGIC
jgi:hypothetical protein